MLAYKCLLIPCSKLDLLIWKSDFITFCMEINKVILQYKVRQRNVLIWISYKVISYANKIIAISIGLEVREKNENNVCVCVHMWK